MIEITDPSGFEYPETLVTVPVSACGVNAAADSKGGRIQLEDIQPSEQFMIGIEELVVVDLRVFTKDPLPAGLVVRLRWAALDLIAEGVLALIGVGQVGVVQHQQAARKKNAGQQQRQRDPVQTEATGLERDELVVLRHHSESNEHGHECSERRELVEQIASEIQKIQGDFDDADAMLRDVIQ